MNYDDYKALNLKLTMTRGIPCKEQLDLSNGLFDSLTDFKSADAPDVRNYGGLLGISEARALFADMARVSSEEIVVSGNSSLNMMHDLVSWAMTHGFNESSKPWGKQDKVRFLCPVPGYDRHFTICEHYGIEMVTVPMDENGPDMDKVEQLVNGDESIKGIWCVPKYSNPTGIIYSDDVVRRFAALTPKAGDFKIFWDNAYMVHELYEEENLLDLFAELKKNGKENMLFMFMSTSKITFPGSGISAVCCSGDNVKYIGTQLFSQTIGPDKVNQLRHVRFLKNAAAVKNHMKKHADIIRPKFEIVNKVLSENFSNHSDINWTVPRGGYFISLDVPKGYAKKTITLAETLGVTLTPAGSTYPYKNDPDDRNIRIAPTFPTVSEMETAVNVLALCIKMVLDNNTGKML